MAWLYGPTGLGALLVLITFLVEAAFLAVDSSAAWASAGLLCDWHERMKNIPTTNSELTERRSIVIGFGCKEFAEFTVKQLVRKASTTETYLSLEIVHEQI